MTWFKERQPRLLLLIWRAPIPDRAFSLFLVFKPGQDSIHLESCFFFVDRAGQPKIMLTFKLFRYNTYKTWGRGSLQGRLPAVSLAVLRHEDHFRGIIPDRRPVEIPIQRRNAEPASREEVFDLV